jgi:AcrR family transcriptional regulator
MDAASIYAGGVTSSALGPGPDPTPAAAATAATAGPSSGATPAPVSGRPRGRGRRPAEEVRADILRAVGHLLLTEGMATFTIERVAQVSGASKTTIYKWWPSKGALALDGYFHAVEETLAFPDTGDIAADLMTQVRAFVALIGQTPAGRVLAELIGQAQTDPDLAAAFSEHYSLGRRRLAVEALERAQQRGQIRPEADPRVVVDQLWGAAYNRLLVPDEPLSDAFAVALVDNLMLGLRTGEDSPAPSRASTPGPGHGARARRCGTDTGRTGSA